MPLPLFLIIGGSILGASGIGAGIAGGVKMKQANDTMQSAQSMHKDNINRFEKSNTLALKAMDKLGETELKVLNTFEDFSDTWSKITNPPKLDDINISSVSLPEFTPKKLKEVSIGAGVALGSAGSAAAGTLGGFAAAGATTAAVAALGTASTGTAIASLSGAAATNAILAALGGGAIAAGGGGVALGTAVLGVSSAGIGLLIGGIVFSVAGKSKSDKADDAYFQACEEKKKVDELCDYISRLNDLADRYNVSIENVKKRYMEFLGNLKETLENKTNFKEFTATEKKNVELLARTAKLLFAMCRVNIVIQSNKKDGINALNTAEAEPLMRQAEEIAI